MDILMDRFWKLWGEKSMIQDILEVLLGGIKKDFE